VMMAVVAKDTSTRLMLATTVYTITPLKGPPSQSYQGTCMRLAGFPLPALPGQGSAANISVPSMGTRNTASGRPARFPKTALREPCTAMATPENAATTSATIFPPTAVLPAVCRPAHAGSASVSCHRARPVTGYLVTTGWNHSPA